MLSLCNPPAVQADLYKLPPLPASRGPWNIPTLLREEIQVSGVSHGHVLLGPGRVSGCPLVSPGFAILQRVEAASGSSQTLSQPPLPVFIPGQSHLPSVSWAKERILTCIPPSGPGRRRNTSLCCSCAQGYGQGVSRGSFTHRLPSSWGRRLSRPQCSDLSDGTVTVN